MFEEILRLRRPQTLSKRAVAVIKEVVDLSMDKAVAGETGYRLAAAFDLLTSAEYYRSVANRGWTYCNDGLPMMIYLYTNTCPRCIGNGAFRFSKANKPESGQIGTATAGILCQMLEYVFAKKGRHVEVTRASEPIDAIVYDREEEKLILAEVKSAPMLTIPLAMPCEKITEMVDGELVWADHSIIDNPMLHTSSIGLFFPKSSKTEEQFVPLKVDWKSSEPFYDAIDCLIHDSPEFFEDYYRFWMIAYEAYANKTHSEPLFWLTNGCGQPVPRPDDWPARKGTGYESVSDGKTSVGMDRTDDIKKAIYQVLKLGAEYKPENDRIKTAIISNIHAVRHYDEYLQTVRDVIWAVDRFSSGTKAGALDPETPVYNLFDGILSFTRSDIRDEWIKEIFSFGGKADGL